MPAAKDRGARASLSVAIITHNEEANLARTLASVAWADEIVIIDSGSTDTTPEIAERFHANFSVEPWRGFSAQKNFALARCTGDWLLSLDADEELSPALAAEIQALLHSIPEHAAWYLPRLNFFLGRPLKHGGYYPDTKLRLIRNGAATFAEAAVHETMQYGGSTGTLKGELLHHAYPSLHEYIEHMDRYSSLGAAQRVANRNSGPFLSGVLLNPLLTFFYNYCLRGGFLDGREGLLMHLYHSVYVSWKYAKAWELAKSRTGQPAAGS